ncbi:MAG: hypothetical protein M3463_14040 [Verrucomicrobiota bacterium]|nr:hypothetical protein [Verrucomicrobiota bacterium]
MATFVVDREVLRWQAIMSYTELWRCKVCQTLPEVKFRGKNFLIQCEVCNSEKTEVFGHSLDEVVTSWNRRNDPSRRGLLDTVKGWFGARAGKAR